MSILKIVLLTALAVVSVFNARKTLIQYRHKPWFARNTMSKRDESLMHAREVLFKLGTTHIGFVAGPGTIVDGEKFYPIQLSLTPLVLRVNSTEDNFFLVMFGDSNPTVPMPGLTLIEDFKNGLALFRKAP